MCMIEFIKKQRYFSKAIKLLITPKDRLKLKEKTRYYVVDPDRDIETADDDEKSKDEEQNSWMQKKAELSSGHFSEPSELISEVEVELVSKVQQTNEKMIPEKAVIIEPTSQINGPLPYIHNKKNSIQPFIGADDMVQED